MSTYRAHRCPLCGRPMLMSFDASEPPTCNCGSGDLASTFPSRKRPVVDHGRRVPPADPGDGPDPEDDP